MSRRATPIENKPKPAQQFTPEECARILAWFAQCRSVAPADYDLAAKVRRAGA